MDKRIGAQLFTIRDFCQTLDGIDKSMEKVSRIGYKTVQLSGIGDFSADDVKKILDKYSLEAVCTHRSPEKYMNDLDGEVDYHNKIGCKICGIGSMPGFKADADTVDKFLYDFNPVAAKLKENNLIFAYHNHAFEFAKEGGKFVFDILTDGIKSDNFKFILDVYWLAVAGLNPSKFIMEHSGKIACVHFKDLKIKGNDPTFASVGEGNLDWDGIIRSCKESDVGYALVEQDICDSDPFDCLARSYEFLSQRGFE